MTDMNPTPKPESNPIYSGKGIKQQIMEAEIKYPSALTHEYLEALVAKLTSLPTK